MGIDTHIIAFDASRFDPLDQVFRRFLIDGDMGDLLTIMNDWSTGDILNDLLDPLRALHPSSSGRSFVESDPEVIGVGCRLFDSLCSPKKLNFTASSFVRYAYSQSSHLEVLFAAGEVEVGESMELFLGPGGMRVAPEVARDMWTELRSILPNDLSAFYPDHVQHLMRVDQRIDKVTYNNVCLAFY